MLLELHEVDGLEFNGTGFSTPNSCVSHVKNVENTNIIVFTIQHTEDEDELSKDEINEWHYGWQEPYVPIRKRKELGL